jgi:hypothetical protein
MSNSNVKLKNLLAENMRRFGTKNLKEDHPGILLPAAKMAAGAGGLLVAAVGLYSKVFAGKTAKEQQQARMVLNIQSMIIKDTDPDKILKYMKSVDPEIDDETGIEIMKALGRQLGVYVDPENDTDATPLS